MTDERKPGPKDLRVPAGKKYPGRAERLTKELRGNLAKRRFQARARGNRG
ncbi:MAG: hypothetical protein HYZ04_03995 [Rhodospirillales bacterium]|nr:hypothetical protein [Rhodospirillales bacterium]MBI2585271.1 hypothetical protein [Rhodospirillales bacterium]MBI2977795.1 hypothetical protein [Rhodospirillales bacterium]MBI3113661.1 hypothetical protein [Rhodospirillales bacterium]